MTMLALTIALAAIIGLSLGLLGGGGSILAVPLLLYVADMPAKEAIATSLLVVGVTSAVAVIPHARAHRVRWRTGLIFGVAGMTGAYAGGRVAVYIPGAVLLTAFALMMLATAAAMIRGRRRAPGLLPPHELPIGKVVVEGVSVGLITGMVADPDDPGNEPEGVRLLTRPTLMKKASDRRRLAEDILAFARELA